MKVSHRVLPISGNRSLDTSTATGRVILNEMGAVGQAEREGHAGATEGGISKAEREGRYKGRGCG